MAFTILYYIGGLLISVLFLSEGWYCSGGAVQPMPTDPSQGGFCDLGEYCPGGSDAPIPCDGGMFCSRTKLVLPTGPCQQGTDSNRSSNNSHSNPYTLLYEALCDLGYYCTSGANTSTPTDGITGDICPMGYFCPENSTAPTACPQGTYLNTTGNSIITSCIDCVPGMDHISLLHICQLYLLLPEYKGCLLLSGYYCDQEGLDDVTDQCNAGYYCPSGQVTHSPISYICPAAHFCLRGSPDPAPCPSGTYQDQTGQDNCKTCPEVLIHHFTLKHVVLS